jgi:hypothetical protein
LGGCSAPWRAGSRFDEGGFDRDRAAGTLTAVVNYALGYAIMELSIRAAVAPAAHGEAALETIVRLISTLPPDARPALVRVARDCRGADPDVQFEFGLDALLAGLHPHCDTHGTARALLQAVEPVCGPATRPA